MTFDILLINTNQFHLADYVKSKIIYDELLEFIEENGQIVTVNSSQQMIGVIIDTLEMTKDTMGHTTNIYESDKNIVQMCHLLDDEHNKSGKAENGLAQLLSKGIFYDKESEDNKGEIRGRIVCMKSKILGDGTCVNESLNFKDFATILYRNCVKRGVVIQYNSTTNLCEWNEIEYIVDPVEFMSLEEKQNMKFFEFQALENIIKVFVEIMPSFDQINEPLSALFGRHNVKGLGIVSLQNVDGKFIDMDKKTFSKILAIMSNKSHKPEEQLNPEHTQDDQPDPENTLNKQAEQKQQIKNFYTILEQKYKKFKETYKNKEYLFEDCGQNERPFLNQIIQLQLSKQSDASNNN